MALKKRLYIVAIGILILSIFIYEHYFIIPQSANIRESIIAKYETLRKYEEFIKDTGITEDDIKKVIEETDNMEERLIKEKSEFLASARLQREIEAFAEKAGLKITTIRPLNVVKYNTYTGVPLYFEGNADIKQLSEFLRIIESEKILTKIDKMNISVTNIQNPKDLKIKMQVSGLVKI